MRWLKQTLRHPALLIWAVFIASMPFYVGRSGLPQPGNAAVLLLFPIAVAMTGGRISADLRRVLSPLFWFTVWVCVVNYSWALVTGKLNTHDYGVHPLYYLFNMLVIVTTVLLHRRFGERFLRLTAYVVIALVLFLVAASRLMNSGTPRGTLFFNNPNQLGYYAVASACLIALVQRHIKFRVMLAGIGILGCAYLSLYSASRAGTAGIGILLVFLLVSNPKLIVAGCLVAVLATNVGPLATSLDYSERMQLLERDRDEDFAEERGYDRLWSFKEHLLLGAGEGDLQRFDVSHEIHSSLGTVAFSYGIIGLTLFVLFLWRVLGRAPLRYQMMLVPTFAYAVAHQGLRFSTFWVLLGVFLACKAEALAAKRETARTPDRRAADLEHRWPGGRVQRNRSADVSDRNRLPVARRP